MDMLVVVPMVMFCQCDVFSRCRQWSSSVL